MNKHVKHLYIVLFKCKPIIEATSMTELARKFVEIEIKQGRLYPEYYNRKFKASNKDYKEFTLHCGDRVYTFFDKSPNKMLNKK